MNLLNKRRNGGGGPAAPNVRNEIDTVRVGGANWSVAKDSDKKLQNQLYIDEDLIKVGSKLSNGQIVCDFPTGDYTYRGVMLAVKAAANATVGTLAAGSSVSLGQDGRYYIRQDALFRLFDRIKLEADGRIIWDFENWRDFEAYMKTYKWGFNGSNGFAFFGFGWPHIFREGVPFEDLFALGTGNIRDLKLTLYTSSNFEDGWEVQATAFFAPQRMPARHVISREVYVETFATAGVHTIRDLPIDRPIHRILVTVPTGKTITDYKLEVGKVELQKASSHTQQMLDMLMQRHAGENSEVGPYRLSSGALSGVGGLVTFDFDLWRNSQTLRPLTTDAQRRRDDEIAIELTLGVQDTEVTVQIFYADQI